MSLNLFKFCSIVSFTSADWAVRFIFVLHTQNIFDTQLSLIIQFLSLLSSWYCVWVGYLTDVLLVCPLLSCCTWLSAVKLLSVALRWVHSSCLAIYNRGSGCWQPLRAKIEVIKHIWLCSMLSNLPEFDPVSSRGWGEICEQPCIPHIWIVPKDNRLSHCSESWLLTSKLFVRGIASVGGFEDRIIFLLIYIGLEFLELDV